MLHFTKFPLGIISPKRNSPNLDRCTTDNISQICKMLQRHSLRQYLTFLQGYLVLQFYSIYKFVNILCMHKNI